MYSEDPRNRKAPSLLLGFIAITGALILALFLTGILKANADDLIDPPHDPMFNNIVFITMTNTYMYVGGDTVIEMYEGSSDGQYAQVWKSNFVQAINNFFSYVPKEQCFIVVASDGASANYMTSIREVLSSVSANYWSGSQDGNFEANDFSGYEDLYAPAGMYNVRYKSRIVKYLPVSPTASPTPTPTPELNSFLLSLSGSYLLVDVYGSGVATGSVTVPYDYSLQELQTEYNSISDQAIYSAFISMPRSNYGPCIAIYFNYSSIDYINVYSLSSNPVDLDYVRNNSSPYSLTIESRSASEPSFTRQTMNNNFYYFCGYKSGYANSMYLGFEYKYSSSNSFSVVNLYDNFLYSGNIQSISEGLGLNYGFYDGSLYKTGLRYRINFEPVDNPFVTPAPPTPTEAPHVIINWPSGTPTPTPPFSVPGNSGTGSGSSGSGSLSPGQIDSTLDTFKSYTENNNAFAFLYACTSVIPDEALYFLFILLFILLLLACIRLFVHFTG